MDSKLLLIMENCDKLCCLFPLLSLFVRQKSNSDYFLVHIQWLDLNIVLMLHQKNYHSSFPLCMSF